MCPGFTFSSSLAGTRCFARLGDPLCSMSCLKLPQQPPSVPQLALAQPSFLPGHLVFVAPPHPSLADNLLDLPLVLFHFRGGNRSWSRSRRRFGERWRAGAEVVDDRCGPAIVWRCSTVDPGVQVLKRASVLHIVCCATAMTMVGPEHGDKLPATFKERFPHPAFVRMESERKCVQCADAPLPTKLHNGKIDRRLPEHLAVIIQIPTLHL